MIKRSYVKKAMRILQALSGLALLAAFLSNSRCATTALSTRNTDGPVKVFELGQRIPKNHRHHNPPDLGIHIAGTNTAEARIPPDHQVPQEDSKARGKTWRFLCRKGFLA
jgi:hypothetical protein